MIRFVDKKLQALSTDATGAEQYERSVVRGFFRVMAILQSAPDPRDFHQLKSLHYEKLMGDRAGQHSLRLTSSGASSFALSETMKARRS